MQPPPPPPPRRRPERRENYEESEPSLLGALVGAAAVAAVVGLAWWFGSGPSEAAEAPERVECGDPRETDGPAYITVAEARRALRAGETDAVGGGGDDCPICLQGPRDVALVGCGHTLCMTCFAHIWSGNGGGTRGAHCTVACPFCRRHDSRGMHLYN